MSQKCIKRAGLAQGLWPT